MDVMFPYVESSLYVVIRSYLIGELGHLVERRVILPGSLNRILLRASRQRHLGQVQGTRSTSYSVTKSPKRPRAVRVRDGHLGYFAVVVPLKGELVVVGVGDLERESQPIELVFRDFTQALVNEPTASDGANRSEGFDEVPCRAQVHQPLHDGR